MTAALGIGDVARRASVSVQAVRYYERIGLLPQPRRTKSGYRKYDEDTVTRLRFVRRAGELGFTLAETRDLLALRARAGAPCKSVRSRAERKLEAIERKLAELTDLRDAVAALVRACSADTAVEHCTILAALSEHDSNPSKKERSTSWPPQSPRAPRRLASHASTRANAASKTA